MSHRADAGASVREWLRLQDRLFDPRCPACAAPHGFSVVEPLCLPCSAGWQPARTMESPVGIPELHAVWEYAGPVRDLILQAKERPDGPAARLLLTRARTTLACRSGPAVFVPAPGSRLRWGGSLAQALAADLARTAGGRREICIRRRRWRPPQAALDGPARRANLHECMRVLSVRPRALRRDARCRAIWLVDDVATTGATLVECARALREAGCAPRGALVLARVS